MLPLDVAPGVTIPAAQLSWSASRASGPGGQNVNKVASRVELRFDLDACDVLHPAAKWRLRTLAGARLSADGTIRIVSQATRDQQRNLEDARDKLRELIVRALVVPKRRHKTRPSAGARAQRLSSKHAQSDKKRARRYRADD